MSGWGWIRARNWQPYDAVRVALGLLLLVAAGLKAHQLATEPTLDQGVVHSPWFLAAVVEFELLFGLWLLAGLWPLLTWFGAIACFALFSAVSSFNAFSGESTCGCFGKVTVSPWFTFVMDLIVVASLLWCSPAGSASQRKQCDALRWWPVRPLDIVLLWLAIAVPLGLLIADSQKTGRHVAGGVLGPGRSVVLLPETWPGAPFPLAGYIDIGERLTRGLWVVLFYHHDCPVCHEAIPRYKAWARRSSFTEQSTRVALIEVPPYQPSRGRAGTEESPCVLGRLESEHRWFVETPLEVTVDQGVVVRVTKG